MPTPPPDTAPRSYDGIAKALHWGIALLVIALVVIGKIMADWMEGFSPERFWLYQLHKSLGITVLALMALRIVWRLTHRPPELVPGMPAWERTAAQGAHLALYGLLLALPLSGWLMVSASTLPIPTLYFGLFQIPHIGFIESLPTDTKATFGSLSHWLHWIAGMVLILIVAGHVAAALRHHFVMRDDTLTRMLPGRTSRFPMLLWLTLASTVLGLFASVTFQGARAEAPIWVVDAGASTLEFEATAGGQAVKGTIGKFDLALTFDPEALAETALKVTIDIASLGTGNSQVDQALHTADWFDVAAHPTATYAATQATKTGEGAYELQGELTLKGITKPLSLPFALTLDGDAATATGAMIIDRTAFGIGRGQAAGAVAPAVKVTLTIAAKRK